MENSKERERINVGHRLELNSKVRERINVGHRLELRPKSDALTKTSYRGKVWVTHKYLSTIQLAC